jgi:rubrerythrin
LDQKRREGVLLLSAKELMQMEDFLDMQQTSIKAMNYHAANIQDAQAKKVFQQIAQKNQEHFQTISKHLNAGQTLQ